MSVDPRLVAAVREQLARRPTGADRVGWKVGRGHGERIGREPVAVGSLTSATLLEPGAAYRGGGRDLRADAEVVVEVGEDGGVAACGVALELCDLADGASPEEVVAANVYHRAVTFGPLSRAVPEVLELVVNGETRGRASVEVDTSARVAQIERVLAAVGERLEPGDRLITGSVVQVTVAVGDEVVADGGPVGRVGVVIA